MKKYNAHLIVMGLALAAVLLFMSACSPSTGATGNGSSSLSVLQVLQKSANVMQKLNSVHFDTTTTGGIKGTYSGTPTASKPTSNNVSFNLKANGDQLMPDQDSAHITLNSTTKVAEIVTSDKVYIQNPQGQWYVLDKSAMQDYIGNPLGGVTMPDTNTWLMLLEHVQITDHGIQSLNGQNLRHISATLDKDSLEQILTSNDQLSSLFGKQNIHNILNSAKSLTGTLAVWIDETNFYVHRTELKFNLNADTSSITPTATVTVPLNAAVTFDSIVDLSKFNEPVTITPPTNAIPTNNPITILGG